MRTALRHAAGLACLLAACLLAPRSLAQTETPSGEPAHIALIIGNTSYSKEAAQPDSGHLPRLPNACGDSEKVAAGLVLVGWDEADITQKCNMTSGEMLIAVRDFVAKVQENPYSIAVFYFAGHGVQIDQSSYIFGVDGKPNFALARKQIDQGLGARMFAGVAVDVYADLISGAGAITEGGFTVIVDACRSDPIIRELSGNGRRVSAPLSRPRLLPGVLVAVSTQDGDAAADDGAYASALKNRMKAKEAIPTILNDVSLKILNDTKFTGRIQVPTMSGALVIQCFAGCSLPGTEQPRPTASRRKAAVLAFLQPRMIKASFQVEPRADTARLVQHLPTRANQSKAYETLFSSPALDDTKSRVRGTRVDLFYCVGGSDADMHEAAARRYGEALASLASKSSDRILSIRIRSLIPYSNGLPGYRFLTNAIVADPSDEGEERIARAAERTTGAKLQRLISRTTSDYVSLFLCEAPVRTEPGVVYWHAPNQGSADTAGQLLAALAEDRGQFRSMRTVDIVGPDRTPSETQVRYYHADDRDIAFRLADSIQTALKHVVPVNLLPLPTAGTIARGTVEVWIGISEATLDPSTLIEPGSATMPSRNNVLSVKPAVITSRPAS